MVQIYKSEICVRIYIQHTFSFQFSCKIKVRIKWVKVFSNLKLKKYLIHIFLLFYSCYNVGLGSLQHIQKELCNKMVIVT